MLLFPVLSRSNPPRSAAANSFRFRSYEKRRILHHFGANKSFRIRSYRHPSCKSFRIRSYKNTGGGVPQHFRTELRFRRHMRHVAPLSPVASLDYAYFPSSRGRGASGRRNSPRSVDGNLRRDSGGLRLAHGASAPRLAGASAFVRSGCYGLLTFGLLTAGILHSYDCARRRDSSPRPDGPIRHVVSLSVP